ncbi:MAG TPA: phenylacetate--CoA ligase [bacterium]|nr:phenylacetate--CoA ligase [bacterium]
MARKKYLIWDRAAECMPAAKRRALQLRRLKATVAHAYARVPYYRQAFKAAKVRPEDIRTLDDIRRLPCIGKPELRAGYPFGMFAVPRREIVEIHTSSGTTGKPVVSGYTAGDIRLWGEAMARAMTMAGATPEDIVQNCYGYGLFTGGLGVHYGAHRIGAMLVPISAGNSKRQLTILQDFGSTIITGTPSYMLHLAELAAEAGIDLHKTKLKAGLFGAEMWTEHMRAEIEKRYPLQALNIYGLTEVIGPGVAQECPAKCGLHIAEDLFFPEVVSPETLEPLPDGAVGELVLTTLTREGMPMLRFRTRDLTSLERGTCACGRTLVRMSRITGRSDDMLKIRGVILFPSQIERALFEIKGLEPIYQIIVSRPAGGLDEVEVRVEASRGFFSDEVRHVEEFKRKVERHIEQAVGLRVKVALVEPKSLPRSEGKAVRVIDQRNL